MFLDLDNRFTSTVQVVPPLPYKHLGKNLISDHKIDGKWVKAVGSGKNQKQTQAYRLWVAMVERCRARRPGTRTYIGCEISENFLDFQFFAEWCQKQIGYGNPGWQLDKDILSNGKKRYSETTCCFVPREINNLFVKRDAARGDYPIGVCKLNGKYTAVCSVGEGYQVYLGCYDTPLAAFAAYKSFKEQLLRQKAADYCDQIDSRVYEALRYYSVSITD